MKCTPSDILFCLIVLRCQFLPALTKIKTHLYQEYDHRRRMIIKLLCDLNIDYVMCYYLEYESSHLGQTGVSFFETMKIIFSQNEKPFFPPRK